MMIVFKIGMFDMDNIKKYLNDFITFNGHLPYYILSVLSHEDIKKRNDYLKSVSKDYYANEIKLLKDERRDKSISFDRLYNFFDDNPDFIDIIQVPYQKLFY